MDRIYWGLTGGQWVEIGISLLILIGVLLLGKWIISLILEKILGRITKQTKNSLDNQILVAARMPGFKKALIYPISWLVLFLSGV